ncbi:hypothetical protein ACA910_021262 [Epithemia clementina (nom. ined.)]
MQSMFCHLLHEHGTEARQLKKLKIVWVQQDPELMEQSQVADVSTRTHRNSMTNGFEEDIAGDLFRERNKGKKFDPTECESLATEIPSNTPTSYETDAELDIVYRSAEIKFPDGSTIKFPDGRDEEDAASTTTKTRHDPSGTEIVDNVKAMDEVTCSSQQGDDDKEIEESEGQELEFERFGDMVDIELYLTGNNNERSALDIPGLQQGRPDLAALFTQMRNEAIRFKEKRVAVCVCGPKLISYIARKACIELSDKNVRFDYHEESFGSEIGVTSRKGGNHVIHNYV